MSGGIGNRLVAGLTIIAGLAIGGCETAPKETLEQKLAYERLPTNDFNVLDSSVSFEVAETAFSNGERLRRLGNFVEADLQYNLAEDNLLYMKKAKAKRREMILTRAGYTIEMSTILKNLKAKPSFTKEQIQFLEKIVVKEPQNHDAWCDLGNAYLGRGNIESMTNSYEMAYRLKRDDPRVQLGRAQSTLLSGKIKRALEFAAEGVEKYPDNDKIRAILVSAHAQLGRVDLAIESLNDGLKLNPENPHLMHARYHFYFDIENWVGAYKDCMRLIDINPSRSLEYRQNLPNLKKLANTTI